VFSCPFGSHGCPSVTRVSRSELLYEPFMKDQCAMRFDLTLGFVNLLSPSSSSRDAVTKSQNLASGKQSFHLKTTISYGFLEATANDETCRVFEAELDVAIDNRNESLPSLRELGPPDLVHLIKQSTKSGRQVRWLLPLIYDIH
jgi:hypothetical protein